MNIYVNVYDLHDGGGASVLREMNMGLHHTGVEIGGYEYSFSASGISRTRPQLPEFGTFREQLLIGTYPGMLHTIHDVVARLETPSGGFGPGQYNILTKNCNHFSDALCFELLGAHIPVWINRAAGVGSYISRGARGSAAPEPPPPPSEKFLAPGVVAAPTLDRKPMSSHQANQTAAAPAAAASSSVPAEGGGWLSGLMSVFSWGGAAAEPQPQTPGIASFSKPAPAPSSNANNKPTPTPAAPSVSATKSGATDNPAKQKQLTEKQKQILAQLKKS
jgi:hypothetical protein